MPEFPSQSVSRASLGTCGDLLQHGLYQAEINMCAIISNIKYDLTISKSA